MKLHSSNTAEKFIAAVDLRLWLTVNVFVSNAASKDATRTHTHAQNEERCQFAGQTKLDSALQQFFADSLKSNSPHRFVERGSINKPECRSESGSKPSFTSQMSTRLDLGVPTMDPASTTICPENTTTAMVFLHLFNRTQTAKYSPSTGNEEKIPNYNE